jgi:hypothetical protein
MDHQLQGKRKELCHFGSEEIFVLPPLAIACQKGLYFLLALV